MTYVMLLEFKTRVLFLRMAVFNHGCNLNLAARVSSLREPFLVGLAGYHLLSHICFYNITFPLQFYMIYYHKHKN